MINLTSVICNLLIDISKRCEH